MIFNVPGGEKGDSFPNFEVGTKLSETERDTINVILISYIRHKI